TGPPVEVVEQTATKGARFEELLEQPAGSQIVVEESADSLTLTVPPTGLLSGSGCLFLIGLFWCGFMTLFTGLMIFDDVKVQHGFAPGWVVVPFVGLFWSVGLGMMLGALHLARRRAVLAVVGDELLILQTGLFGSKERRFTRRGIADVCCGPSG